MYGCPNSRLTRHETPLARRSRGGPSGPSLFHATAARTWVDSSPAKLEGWANRDLTVTTTRRVFYSKLCLHRSAMYTRCIDSNLESGRYISRVGRASSFLSLPESTSLYCGTYCGTVPACTMVPTVSRYQLCTSLLRKDVSRRACKLYRSSVRSEREEQPRNSGASSILSYKLPLMISSRAA